MTIHPRFGALCTGVQNTARFECVCVGGCFIVEATVGRLVGRVTRLSVTHVA